MKSEKVVFIDDELENAFNLLPAEDPLKKGIIKAIQAIRENCNAGEIVKKNSVILKNYNNKFGVTNLRVYDLPLAYRLMYSVTEVDVKIVSAVLDWKTHKEYDRLNKNIK
jgi:hypothetical protein